MEFLAVIAAPLLVYVQKLRANPNIPDYVSLPIAIAIGIGAYMLGAETVELASREWWQGAIMWALSALGVVQLTSGVANMAGVKSMQTK